MTAGPGPAGAAIEAIDLRKAYGRREILGGVSFEVARGELFALLGPNGAGKTTTVEILEGYRRPDAGSARVLGLDPSRDARRLRPRIGLMLQEGGIDNRSTPREVLRLYARFYRDPEDPDALLEAVDLGHAAKTRYRRLSGGEKQRLGLALALLGRPELLVLDEPTAGMDPAAKRATRDRIMGLRAAGTTVLLTTHELDDVERLADRVAVLDRGRIVAVGTPAELTGGGAPRLRFRLSRGLDDRERADLGAVVARLCGGTPVVSPDGDGGGYVVDGLAASPDPAAGRRPRRLVRDPRPAPGGAAGRRGEPRGALPRARRGGRGTWTPRRTRRSASGRAGRSRRRTVIGAGVPARPAPWPVMAAALAANELRLALRRGEGLLITFVIPVGVLLVFSALDTGGTTPAVDRLLPGAIALAVIAAAFVSLAITTGFERQYGVIKRLGGSPAGSSALVAAKTAAVIVVELVQLVLLVGIAAGALGWTAGPTASGVVTVAALVLGTIAFAGLGLLIAGTLRAEATLALANLLFLVFLVLGGIVLPLDRLPDAVAQVAAALPAAALTQALAIGLGNATGDAGPSLALLGGWAVVLAGLAAWRFRWD